METLQKDVLKSTPLLSRIWTIFGGLMVAMYFGIGLYVLLSPKFDYIQKEFRVIFSVFLIVYGFFRLVRLFMKVRSDNDEN